MTVFTKGGNMKRCVVVFKSKTQVMYFIEIMKNNGVNAKSVSTPKEAKIGCGISAEVPYSSLSTSLKIIKKVGFDSFYGVFLIEKRGNRTTTTKI